jgi:mono/diheme cytochrome c family protein
MPAKTKRGVPLRALIIVVVAVAIAVGGFFTWLGTMHGFSARAKPSAFEAMMARMMRSMAMPRRAQELKNAYPQLTAAQMTFASEHFAAHCAVCHDNNGDGRTMLGANMYPHPPDLRGLTTQDKSDGDLYFTIRNGIRMSGMPAWGDDTPKETWELVDFIRRLPHLTPAELARMRKYNPKTIFEEPLMPQGGGGMVGMKMR